MVLLPVFLYLFMGSELADIVEVGPFIEALPTAKKKTAGKAPAKKTAAAKKPARRQRGA